MTKLIKKQKTPSPKNSERKVKKRPSKVDMAEFLDMAYDRGTEKRRWCKHLKGVVCDFHT